MGGEIGATSEAGVGSRFFFRIPIQFAPGAVRRDMFEGVDPRTIRLLVVNDNETICEMLQQSLTKLRFVVDTVTSGEAAIEAYQSSMSKRPYHALLVDWKMDGIDGLETVRRIRALGSVASQAPVISMFSSSDMWEISDELASLGVEQALQKPINTSFLVDVLMMILQSTSDRRPVRLSRTRDGGDTADLGGLRILLAEDNELNQMVAQGVLDNLGCQVEIAENGRIAVDLLKQHGPDHYAIVLMDIQMPVMDGLTATRTIRSELNMSDLPVIAMTAHALEEERDRCLEAGMNDHISKPVDARDIKTKITKWARTSGNPLAATPEKPGQPQEVEDPKPEAEGGVDSLADISARLMIPQEVVQKLLSKFVEDYADGPAQMAALVRDGKLEDLESLAHSIKGVAGSLGLMEVSQQSAALEDALKAGTFAPDQWDEADMVNAFEKTVHRIERALNDAS